MWGLIVSIALGGMLLMVAITALRDGELSVGETTFERGQPLFAVVVALLFAAGAGLGGYAAVVGWRTQQGEPRQVDGERFVMTLPASWKQDDDMATMLSRGGSMQALAYTGQGDELVVSWPTDPQPGATGVDQLVTQLEDPSIAYRKWLVERTDQAVAVDMEYPSPRGDVVARVVARQLDEGLFMVTAMCSHQGDPSRCRQALASLKLK